MGASALTIKSTVGFLRQLTSPVEIIFPNTTNKNEYLAIWDTGATGSVITQEVVKNLGLKPTGMSNVFTTAGPVVQETYIVDIALNAGIILKDVTVTCATSLGKDCNVLIGMDVIIQGDLSITNKNGITCMSFRVPSMHEIDFCAHPNMIANSNPNRGSNLTPPKKKRK